MRKKVLLLAPLAPLTPLVSLIHVPVAVSFVAGYFLANKFLVKAVKEKHHGALKALILEKKKTAVKVGILDNWSMA